MLKNIKFYFEEKILKIELYNKKHCLSYVDIL